MLTRQWQDSRTDPGVRAVLWPSGWATQRPCIRHPHSLPPIPGSPRLGRVGEAPAAHLKPSAGGAGPPGLWASPSLASLVHGGQSPAAACRVLWIQALLICPTLAKRPASLFSQPLLLNASPRVSFVKCPFIKGCICLPPGPQHTLDSSEAPLSLCRGPHHCFWNE